MANRKQIQDELLQQAMQQYAYGRTKEDVKLFLQEEGAYPLEVERIARNAIRDLKKQYDEQVAQLYIQGLSEQEIANNLEANFDTEVLDQILRSGYSDAKRMLQQQALALQKKGVTSHQAVELLNSPLANQAIVESWYAAKDHAAHREQEESSNQSVVLGAVIMVIGIVLTLATDRIFYGAIGVGLITMLGGVFRR